ncbi:deah (asp-glu-ala-his) box polypeptide isoform cra_a [Chrysochromulina tobinii]|uniref:Deah (Asp-glu-ala-his) box polypeptide isoform cra_a n=1 Tax=Chrysochromulina tobinii TaxID=1460289 RepID=A0A0M0K663_9EUKA|nr:deah (asp-glu-ala-his) box polypeptide isoform cra_a [Chrysochromulina tobinii]|eukprot:KOO34305.1 deah (asp-glu-ala-his) box polypeptide isoform cra_a [Chrysochromulina sp. CCMP291]
MTKKKHAKAPSVQENYYVCAPCGKECSGETSLLQHCMGLEHFRRVGHRGFAGCIPNKLGQIPPLSDEFFVRIAQGPAGLEQTDKFFQTLYRCAACGTTVSGHISFVEHCRGKAHIKKAGFSGFAGLLPNDAGIIPPVPPQLLTSMPAAQPAMPDFAVAAAAAAAALVAAGDSGAPGAASGTAPAVAAAPAVPPPVKEKKAVSVRMNQASLAALSRAASNHDREKITGKGPSAGERAAEKAAKAAARALERNKHGGNRAGPVPQLEVPFGPFAADRAKLPIANFRETVLQTMRANQVTVLQGDTGCGKTTQVPQFILEEAAATGTHISIVCTQPRRISAMGVAERVAQERGEALGRTVGYAIRLENKSSSATRLLFCTTGILLRRLEEDPTLQGTTHVVVDEVHERSVESDFLLMVLRDTLRDQRPDLRLPPAGQGDPESSYGEAQAVLVFLQGIKEIVAVQDALLCTREYSQEPARSWVLAVHSSVPPEEQRMAFKRPPPGVRKVVLATNIAETAITIDDVSFVIDCCRMKENRYDPATRMESLDDVPISQANAKQRRGRAGRCRPGVAFHLVTKRTLDAAPTHQAPEVQRMPLDRLILAIKALNYDRSAANALSRTTVKVKPAVEAEDGKEAQEAEFEIGEELTSLGLHLSRLPVDVHIGKLILLGAIFNRTNDVLTIAATLSTRTPFLSPVQRREEADQAKRRFAFNQSDHLTMLRAYNEWDALSGNAKFDFCRENFLGVRTLQSISGLKRQLLELLCDAGFVKSSTPLRVRAVEALGRREDGSDGVKLALVGFLSGEGVCPHCSKEAGAQDMGGGMGGGMGGMHGQMSAQMGGQMGSGMMHSASFESGLSSFGAAEAERLRLNEAAAAQMDADGKLLVGLLCAALYPQVIALEREETKKKKGMNAPVKLRIRDRNEDGTGASDPVEVALHPSSVNASHEKAIASSYLIYHEKVRTTRVYVRDCSPVSAYALILFGGVLSSQPGVPPPPPPVTKKNRHRPPPPQVAKDGILVIDGWIMFSVSVQEQRLLLGVRQKLDELLASKIDSPELEVAEAGKELLSAVSQVLASN